MANTFNTWPNNEHICYTIYVCICVHLCVCVCVTFLSVFIANAHICHAHSYILEFSRIVCIVYFSMVAGNKTFVPRTCTSTYFLLLIVNSCNVAVKQTFECVRARRTCECEPTNKYRFLIFYFLCVK